MKDQSSEGGEREMRSLLAPGDLVAIPDEGSTAALILEMETGGSGALVQLANGDRVHAGFVQMERGRRFDGRRWVPVTIPK